MDIQSHLTEAERELLKLSEERDVLDRKIKGLIQVIEGFRFICNEPNILPPMPTLQEAGLTSAVRNYFTTLAAGPVFPVEIRDALMSAGYNEGGTQGVLLAVHSILSRMEKKGEIDPVEREGKTAYQWVSLLTRAMRETERQKVASGRLRPAGVPMPPSDRRRIRIRFAKKPGLPPPPGDRDKK
jgi:hypothetical protein